MKIVMMTRASPTSENSVGIVQVENVMNKVIKDTVPGQILSTI
jgi:hypothetical protein